MVIFIVLVIVVLVSILTLVIFTVLVFTKVPFVKTPNHVTQMVLDKLDLSEKDIVYDLGCGDGSTLIAIEKKFGAKTIGYEISPWAFFLGQVNIARYHAKTKILYKNFYKQDLSDATVIFCFLINSVMDKVGQQLKKQLKPGSTVISFAFHIPKWEPVDIIDTGENTKISSKIYIYKV